MAKKGGPKVTLILCPHLDPILTEQVIEMNDVSDCAHGVIPSGDLALQVSSTDLNAVVEHWDLLSPALDPKSPGFDQNSPQMARYAS